MIIEIYDFLFSEYGHKMYDIYWKNEQKCRKYAKIMAGYPILQQMMYVSAIYVSISSMLADDYDTTAWSLPFQMCVPFNTNKVSGWYLLWFIQWNESLTYAFIMVSTTLYFICCCFYIDTFCHHLAQSFQSIQNDMDDNRNEKNPDKYIAMKLKLFDVVKFHSNILE